MAKTRLEVDLLIPQVRANKVTQKLVASIVDATRCMGVLQRDIEVKRAEIERLTASGQVKYAARETDLMGLAMILLQLQDQNMGGREAQEIFIEEDDPIIQGRRRNLGELIRSLRFLYTFDPVGQVDGEYLRVVEEATPEWEAVRPDPLAAHRRDRN